MKRAIVMSVGIFALIAGVQEAAAQYAGGSSYAQPYASGYDVGGGYMPGAGPVRVGGGCVVTTDSGRGYGFVKQCDPPHPPARH
jgi:hypothetical protein